MIKPVTLSLKRLYPKRDTGSIPSLKKKPQGQILKQDTGSIVSPKRKPQGLHRVHTMHKTNRASVLMKEPGMYWQSLSPM